MPERIRRKRTKGWRMPQGAVYVGRPSRWGNPFRVGRDAATIEEALAWYRIYMGALNPAIFLAPLRGRDLACWCPLDQPCHADVLLELANRATPGPVVGA